MADIPSELVERRDEYCNRRGKRIRALRGWGFDGFVWQMEDDNMLKVFRHEHRFESEFSIYQRLGSNGIERLQGFNVPLLLHYDDGLWVLELSYVRPPFVLDFAEATLDHPAPGFDPEDEEWIQEKKRVFGTAWPHVSRLLDSLRHYGIHYKDVHTGNICVEP